MSTCCLLRCMRFLLFFLALLFCLHTKLVSEVRGAWALGTGESLSPSCQEAFKVFSSCSSWCGHSRPHPYISCCYVTMPAGCTKGTLRDRQEMIRSRNGGNEGMNVGKEKKRVNDRQGGRSQRLAWVIIHMYYFTVSWRIKNAKLVDVLTRSERSITE